MRYVAIFIGVIIFLLVPLSFMFSPQITTVAEKILHLKINSDYTGGDVWGVIDDSIEDDNGAGAVTYPRHRWYKKGGDVDLVEYKVHEPVAKGKWSVFPSYWQIEVSFAALHNDGNGVNGFTHPVIHIYIDTDSSTGSCETYFKRCENVTFQVEHPWNYFIHVDGFTEPYITSYDSSFHEKISLYTEDDENKVVLRIPIKGALTSVLSMKPTFHYVAIGLYDMRSSGNFTKLKDVEDMHYGGGSFSNLTPNIYDYLDVNGDQKIVLTSYDTTSFTYAVLTPVAIPAIKKAVKMRDNSYQIMRYKTVRDSLAKIDALGRLESEKGVKKAEIYFTLGDYKKAKMVVDSILKRGEYSPTAFAVKGAILAIEGGEKQKSNIMETMALIKEAELLLDSAVTLAEKQQIQKSVYLYRANVYASIPHDVFGKAGVAAADFTTYGEIALSSGDTTFAAICLYNASNSWKVAGNIQKSTICMKRSGKLIGR